MRGNASSISTEPGGREPAPGQLGLVQAFMNTHYDLAPERQGREVLDSPQALASWLSDRGIVEPGARARRQDLDRALALRVALREAVGARENGASADTELGRLDALARGVAIEVRLERSGPRFVSADDGSVGGAVGVMLAIVGVAVLDGRWARLKLCPGRDCGWAFYDHSRNQTGRWCSMSVCGARAKARAHYWRARE